MTRTIILLMLLVAGGCSSGIMKNKDAAPEQMSVLTTNQGGRGPELIVEFYKGKSFYYPLMAVWLEDQSGKYIQSLYVPPAVATGVFRYGKQENGNWVPASKRAPQTLPYWAHKRGVIASDGLYMPEKGSEVPDAYSGATPVQSFVLNTRADKDLPAVYKVLLEVNQNWDWNEFWTNDKYPDDENYKMSCQPAVVYEAVITPSSKDGVWSMKPIGHSHYSGKSGELFPDLNTLTTALSIADSIIVRVK
ncbi:MAG: hypothetical protein IPJ16_17630 [Bacteroidales bacterium]|nr:hypothetical protein [Bacteroidales bacterium]